MLELMILLRAIARNVNFLVYISNNNENKIIFYIKNQNEFEIYGSLKN